jgi:hypothetical protein
MFASMEYPISPSEAASWRWVWNVYLMNFGSALNLLSGRKLTNAVYSLSLSGVTKDFHGKAGTTLFLQFGC